MGILPFLIGWPVLVAVLIPFLKSEKARSAAAYAGAGGLMALAAGFLLAWLSGGSETVLLYESAGFVGHAMLAGEVFLMALIVVLSVKYKKYPVILLSVAQTALSFWTELAHPAPEAPHMRVDSLSMLMCVIVAFVGGFICIYAVGYMKAYHRHHKEYRDRTGFFLSMLFLFLGAMLGLVLSENLVWMYFFWEITSVVSFLLIGYTRTEEAVTNSFRALWMNLLGGLGFAAAISAASLTLGSVQLDAVVEAGAVIPIALLSLAGITKSAQLPFSSWPMPAQATISPRFETVEKASTFFPSFWAMAMALAAMKVKPPMSETMVPVMVPARAGASRMSR